MNRLSANLKNMNLQQLQQLPELIKVVITRPPAELRVSESVLFTAAAAAAGTAAQQQEQR
jgi:hypothetical protein